MGMDWPDLLAYQNTWLRHVPQEGAQQRTCFPDWGLNIQLVPQLRHVLNPLPETAPPPDQITHLGLRGGYLRGIGTGLKTGMPQ